MAWPDIDTRVSEATILARLKPVTGLSNKFSGFSHAPGSPKNNYK